MNIEFLLKTLTDHRVIVKQLMKDKPRIKNKVQHNLHKIIYMDSEEDLKEDKILFPQSIDYTPMQTYKQ